MKILMKAGDEIILVHRPDEEVRVGESLILKEPSGRGLLVQVIEENLVDLPGILEDTLRREAISRSVKVVEVQTEPVKDVMDMVQNMKASRAKIRKEVMFEGGSVTYRPWSGWTPTREASVERLDDDDLRRSLEIGVDYQVEIGSSTHSLRPFVISAKSLQGINVIVGKKGTGKSHIAKTILLGLIDHGAQCIVFDINDEYSNLRWNLDGSPSEYHERIISLEPNPRSSRYTRMAFTLPYIGLDVMYSVMVEALGLPDASAFAFRNAWRELESRGSLSLANLESRVLTLDSRVREAILRRLDTIRAARIITDDEREETTIESLLDRIRGGGAIVINLKAKDSVTQRIVVQTVVSKLQQILEDPESRPLFVVAEEAHFYIDKVMWLDLVTRMRHLGAYQIYMTNTPTSIDDVIIRQTDNIFIFNLTNKSDLEHIMPATKIDRETVMSLVPSLPPRTCLVVGQATSEYPFIVETRPLPVATAGETRLLWR